MTWTVQLASHSITQISLNLKLSLEEISVLFQVISNFKKNFHTVELNYVLGSKFSMLKDEIKSYSEKYKLIGDDAQDICEYNSNMARDKKFVAKLWKDIPTALKEMTQE